MVLNNNLKIKALNLLKFYYDHINPVIYDYSHRIYISGYKEYPKEIKDILFYHKRNFLKDFAYSMYKSEWSEKEKLDELLKIRLKLELNGLTYVEYYILKIKDNIEMSVKSLNKFIKKLFFKKTINYFKISLEGIDDKLTKVISNYHKKDFFESKNYLEELKEDIDKLTQEFVNTQSDNKYKKEIRNWRLFSSILGIISIAFFLIILQIFLINN